MDEVLPNHLYKYQAVNVQALTNLRESQLWCAGPRDFNDPFDCGSAVPARLPAQQYVDHQLAKGDFDASRVARLLDEPGAVERLTQGFHETACESIRQSIVENVYTRGVSCLSATYDDILMWGHYANGHRGFCLGFDTTFHPFSGARRVHYQATAPEINALQLMRGELASDQLVDLLMFRKFTTWQYEREWRLLHRRARTTLRYSPEALTDVFLGVEMPSEQCDLVRQILVGKQTRVHQMRRADSGFAVERLVTPVVAV